jgi:cytochrome c oxidase subunit I
MADILTSPHAGVDAHHGKEPDYIEAKKGIWSWMSTVDHKRLGLMYLWAVIINFILGGIFALLVRITLLTGNHGDNYFISAEMYNRFFTLHGIVMVFLVIIPSVPAALGNFVLPLMLGAKDVAFPRMNLASFWIYLLGMAMATVAILTGMVDTGWTFYTPYSSTTNGPVSLMALAAFTLGFSSIFTGINFVATVHKLRAPGMTWFDMPLFVWGVYATALIQVLATPVVGITLVLLTIERAWGIGVFDASKGGDPVLFQHFFWFYSHPAVYIMILPGMAIISEIIPTFSQKTMFGYKAIGFSSVAIALIGFLVWGHHMFPAGQSQLASLVFSFLTFLVAIPSGIKVFNWIATMWRGNISMDTPMVWAVNFLLLFAIGGLTGIFLGTLSTDIHLHDTYFVVAHFHYVMMGGTITAFLGGVHYWWPKMYGRMYNESIGKIAAYLYFIGFNVLFLSQFVMGSNGMPRRYYNYLPEFQSWHISSTVGSWIIAAGLFLALFNLLASLRKPKTALDNPWKGTTLEWQTQSPPIEHNFHDQPVLTRAPYDYRRPVSVDREIH